MGGRKFSEIIFQEWTWAVVAIVQLLIILKEQYKKQASSRESAQCMGGHCLQGFHTPPNPHPQIDPVFYDDDQKCLPRCPYKDIYAKPHAWASGLHKPWKEISPPCTSTGTPSSHWKHRSYVIGRPDRAFLLLESNMLFYHGDHSPGCFVIFRVEC